MFSVLNAGNAVAGGIISKKKKEYSTNPHFKEAMEAGISPLNFQAMKDFGMKKTSSMISQEQDAYQANMQRRNEALSSPKSELYKNVKIQDVAPTNKAATDQIESEIGNNEPTLPANRQGNAKPVFDPAFEEKASFLAGTDSQAERVGY